MKKIALLLFTILLANPSHSQNQALYLWQKTVEKKLLGVKNISFRCDVTFRTLIDGTTVDSNTIEPIYISSSPNAIYQKNGNCISLLTVDSMFMYYYQEGSITYGRYSNPHTEFEKNTINRLLGGWFRELDEIIPFYINPRKKELYDLPFSSIIQIDSNNYMLSISVKEPWSRTTETGLVITTSETIHLWVDYREMLVTKAQRIIDNSTLSTSWSKVTDINISNISFDTSDFNATSFRELITSAHNNCDLYNINQGQTNPSEAATYVYAEDENKLFDATLFNLSYDTTSIRKISGWILVDIWQFGCKPCAKFHHQLSREQDSLGYRILENNGITLLCLNPLSLVTESLVKYAELYGITDITYSAKSILGSLNWYSYPYYILISPDKKIIYKGNDLGENYQTIINAITSHEKK